MEKNDIFSLQTFSGSWFFTAFGVYFRVMLRWRKTVFERSSSQIGLAWCIIMVLLMHFQDATFLQFELFIYFLYNSFNCIDFFHYYSSICHIRAISACYLYGTRHTSLYCACICIFIIKYIQLCIICEKI